MPQKISENPPLDNINKNIRIDHFNPLQVLDDIAMTRKDKIVIVLLLAMAGFIGSGVWAEKSQVRNANAKLDVLLGRTMPTDVPTPTLNALDGQMVTPTATATPTKKLKKPTATPVPTLPQ